MEVLINDNNVLCGLYFQDKEMKQVFAAYPELLCMDATYKLVNLRFPFYILLAEDGNGQSEVFAAFLLLEETEAAVSSVMDIFKKHNPSWKSVRVLMSDKDFTEREVLSKSFPSAQLLICLYHTFRSFRREITMEKMGITSGQRNCCLDLLQSMAYATSEEKYLELYATFKSTVPPPVLNYFNEQWHQIRHQWVMGMKYSSGNFLNSTNNRLESLNAKLKSVIARYSTLEEFVEKFFLILRVLRSERDYKASTAVQKVPVAFHSTTDKASLSYMQYLTPYAYNFVAKQMSLKDKIRFTVEGPRLYHHSTAEGKIEVTTVSCQCMSWKSMRLPCRHILAARVNAKMDMFSESLCDKRWSLPYYKSQQRVFLADDHVTADNNISVVTFSSPKKRILSQVRE